MSNSIFLKSQNFIHVYAKMEMRLPVLKQIIKAILDWGFAVIEFAYNDVR